MSVFFGNVLVLIICLSVTWLMCSSRKYPYSPHRRFFVLQPPSPQKIPVYFHTYTIFINGSLAIFCLFQFLKKFISPHYQTLQNMLSWEVSEFLVKRLQSYGSFKHLYGKPQQSLTSLALMFLPEFKCL